ncbi:lactate dehydrogenase B [Syncephalis pseudoplumigaleata]|uniref:Lactate dehydrogenase B n=1 Tax=Syncephalis pseudoplumigaleata TaxID=1712513 RepID=A0A4P9Z0G2_9FUNG|nr:lactate dehydrogenase B [Syncephalis pseudoplumigaleata]|eukprot:RKP25874.1 lactate dehydrogenase B [Syncephalis pseudoplumigaleata]
MPNRAKIAIIGAGAVGAACAYACMLRRVPAELIMVDVVESTLEGQVLDLSDANFLTPMQVSKGTNKEAGQCNVIIITAGVKQRDANEPRSELIMTHDMQLIERNYKVLKSIIDGMQPIRKDAILMLVSNPVDVLAFLAHKISGLPHSQVIGSGTFLDSMRLRGILAHQLGMSENALHCYVMGEHGDRQFVGWSSASVGCVRLCDHPAMRGVDLDAIEQQVMRKAYDIIERKGATCFGIGACVASLCDTILNDLRDVRPISCWSEEHQCYVSRPAVVGLDGVHAILDLVLNEKEQERLNKAVQSIQASCQTCDKPAS